MNLNDKPPPDDGSLTEEKIRFLVERARGGDKIGLEQLREMFDKHPEVWRQYGDLAHHISGQFIEQISGTDQALSESLARRVAELKAKLTGESATPLEQLLIERITSSWLVACYAEAALASQGEVSLRQAAFNTKRVDQAHRRHLAAVKALATVRKLLPREGASPVAGNVGKANTKTDRKPAHNSIPIRPRINPRGDDISDATAKRESDVVDPLKLKPLSEIKLDARTGPNDQARKGE